MPGYGLFQVKCEPSSEEEDSNSQFTYSYTNNKLITPELRPVKLELDSQRDHHVPAHLLQHLQGASSLEELAPPAPAGPAATPVCVKQEPTEPAGAATLETLESTPHANTSGSMLFDRHLSLSSLSACDSPDCSDFMPLVTVKDEPLSEGEQHTQSGDDTSDSSTQPEHARGSPKSWTQKDMDNALEALRKHNMSLTKASATYGIPSTTLWQRAHRLGIDTPKKEGGAKSWGERELRAALLALRQGAISANKASKAYGIPSSTLYKIARREGIRLAAPFNAAPTAWRRVDLERALASIRCGASSVQRAATQFGIPTGTLYGRCKREGIELSRSNPTPWSEDAMGEALEAVRVGQMSINQAAIHYNLPYSSLYGRFKRCKYQPQGLQPMQQELQKPHEMEHHHIQELNQYYHQSVPTHTIHQMLEDHNINDDHTIMHTILREDRTTIHEDHRDMHEDQRIIHEDQRTMHDDHRTMHDNHRTINDDHRTIHADQRSMHGEQRIIHEDHRTMHEDHRTMLEDHRPMHENHRITHADQRSMQGDQRIIHEDHRTMHEDHETINNDHRTIHENQRIINVDHRIMHEDHRTMHEDHETINDDHRTIHENQRIIHVDHRIMHEDHRTMQEDHRIIHKDHMSMQEDRRVIHKDYTNVQHPYMHQHGMHMVQDPYSGHGQAMYYAQSCHMTS